MKTKLSTILIVLMLGVCTAKADLVFDSGYNIFDDSYPYYDEVFVENDAILDFTGGEIGKLEGRNNCSINITGGIMSQLWSGDDTLVNIFECDQLEILEARHDSIINLYTNDFIYSPTGGDMEQGYIEGLYYSTTTAFFISFYDDTSYSHLSMVPEPTTLLLFGLSGFLLART